MHCPFCAVLENRVLDSRLADDGHSIRRRRECSGCNRRFTTYERIEETVLSVVKKDGRRERFDRQKVLKGVLRACEKRPVPSQRIDEIVHAIEHHFRHRGDSEVSSLAVGEQIMEQLRQTDEVAYVRFASVYKEFKDVSRFAEELKVLDRLRKTLQETEES